MLAYKIFSEIFPIFQPPFISDRLPVHLRSGEYAVEMFAGGECGGWLGKQRKILIPRQLVHQMYDELHLCNVLCMPLRSIFFSPVSVV